MQSGLDGAIESVASFATSLWDSLVQLYEDVTGKISEIITDVTTMFTDFINSALSWGSDLISNIVSGITGGVEDVRNAVSNIAQTIADHLHFSVPRVGVLSDFDERMGEHLIQNLVDGIYQSQGTLQRALDTTGNTISNAVAPDYTNILGGISSQLAGMGGGGVPSVLNVYIGNQKFATAVIDANSTNNYRSGGIG